MEEYTRKLANFCSDLNFEAIPEKILSIARWCILDNLGIIIGATKTEFGKTIIRYTKLLGDREEATILGDGSKSSARNAALANGSLSEALELQDGYTKGGYHPCCGTISASLATSEWKGKSGKDLITAIVAGYEVGNRVSESIFPSHLSKGFQPTGTAGSVGAAAAAGKLLGLDREQLYNALGIAGFILPISTGDNLWGGYTVKPVHGGAAAKTGIEAAMLAMEGLNAAPLEGDRSIGKGFLRVVSDGVQLAKLTEGLGNQYTLENLYFKPYALCRCIHAPVEVAIGLKEKYGLKIENIEKVVVRTYDFAAYVPGQTRTTADSDATRCQFSVPYGVAAALMYGQVGLEQMMGEATRDTNIHDFAQKIDVVHDHEMDKLRPKNRPAAVDVTLKDKRVVSGQVDFPKGDMRKPMTEKELIQKFSDLTRDIIGEEKSRHVMDTVFSLEKIDSIEELILQLS